MNRKSVVKIQEWVASHEVLEIEYPGQTEMTIKQIIEEQAN